MVIRHDYYVISHVKMRISSLKDEKGKMQCELCHRGWLSLVSASYTQNLSHFGAAFECAGVGGCRCEI